MFSIHKTTHLSTLSVFFRLILKDKNPYTSTSHSLSLFIAYIFIMSSDLNGTNSKVSTCNTQRNENFFYECVVSGVKFSFFFLLNMHFQRTFLSSSFLLTFHLRFSTSLKMTFLMYEKFFSNTS